MSAFMQKCACRVGASLLKYPRTTFNVQPRRWAWWSPDTLLLMWREGGIASSVWEMIEEESIRRRQLIEPKILAQKGLEIGVAHLVLENFNGRVKFMDVDKWYSKEKDETASTLPKGLTIEGIDLSGSAIAVAGFEQFRGLKSIRYLNVSGCSSFDDWCLSELIFLRDSLEVLDVSGCKWVTDLGLSTLYNLKNLKAVNVSDLPNFLNPEFHMTLLEEMMPNTTFIGGDTVLQSDSNKQEVSKNEGRLLSVTMQSILEAPKDKIDKINSDIEEFLKTNTVKTENR